MRLAFLLSVVLLETYGENMPAYTRIKRAKYYPSPPQRYYRRPPINYPSGAFSYTPPPGYMAEDEDSRPGNSPPRPYKVSKPPSNEGLSDEDIINMMKYLSKKDLDKIVEFAAEKDRRSQPNYNEVDSVRPHRESSDNPHIREQGGVSERFVKKREDSLAYQEIPSNKFSLNRPYLQGQKEDIQYSESYIQTTPRIIYATPSNNLNANVQLEGAESNSPLHFVDQYISNDLGATTRNNNLGNAGLLDQQISESDNNLPRPVNLRQEYEASYTNNVPAIAAADPSRYKVENFGDLPLMDYNSKLHTVSSYHVPHYTVTSPPPQNYGPQRSPPVEAAPATAAARAQSDAHLKAIKIWTHKSRGTAYTLHKDGTLSLEAPARPKPKYGYP